MDAKSNPPPLDRGQGGAVRSVLDSTQFLIGKEWSMFGVQGNLT